MSVIEAIPRFGRFSADTGGDSSQMACLVDSSSVPSFLWIAVKSAVFTEFCPISSGSWCDSLLVAWRIACS